MAETGRGLKYPSQADVVRLNRLHAQENAAYHTGGENIRDSSTLEWVLEAIQHPLFDSHLFPSTAEKAAALAWYLARGHVFVDANKRTAFSAMLTFLDLNGYKLEATPDEFVEIALRVSASNGEYEFTDFVAWIRSKLQIIGSPTP